MSEQPSVLLLIGSPKQPRSTSASLGGYLIERLRERGLATDQLHVHRALASDENRDDLLEAVDRCDLLILAFPLYVDCLPAPVIRTLELIAARRAAASEPRPQRLLAVVNCGFPEARHTDTALRICRRFAEETGLEWVGGLGLGGGEAINSRSLAEVGGMVRNVIKSLDLTAEALAEAAPLPQQAVRLMAKPLVPSWVYTWFGSMRWRRDAKKHGVLRRLGDRPYQ